MNFQSSFCCLGRTLSSERTLLARSFPFIRISIHRHFFLSLSLYCNIISVNASANHLFSLNGINFLQYRHFIFFNNLRFIIIVRALTAHNTSNFPQRESFLSLSLVFESRATIFIFRNLVNCRCFSNFSNDSKQLLS